MISQIGSLVRRIVPPLSYSLHKGQCGRVCVIGGCSLYTGAPFYAAMSSLKAGADITYVICTESAGIMKSYSPELMILPILPDGDEIVSDVSSIVSSAKWFLGRTHSLVVGPGLGRDAATVNVVLQIVEEAKDKGLELIFDGDGMWLVSEHPELVQDYSGCILTPNIREYLRLREAVHLDGKFDESNVVQDLQSLASSLGGVTIVKKGKEDVIGNGVDHLVLPGNVEDCFLPGQLDSVGLRPNPRRCGGQGDVLSGSMGTFVWWAKWAASRGEFPWFDDQDVEPSLGRNRLLAAAGACILTKRASSLGFQRWKRAVTTPSILSVVDVAFEELYPVEVID